MNTGQCRFCGTTPLHTFLDLGASPLSNAYLTEDRLTQGEMFFPLQVRVCPDCWLVQLDAVEAPENIFTDYAYFSSFSTTWLEHCDAYAATMIDRFKLGADSHVVELASNDGGLLKCFLDRGVPVLGVDPAANVAAAAEEIGVPTRVAFWGAETAKAIVDEGKSADLIAFNNVLAHVPDINDFIAGVKIALKPSGVMTVEFPHLQKLIEGLQFDTVYHEHYSYLSLIFVQRLLETHGLCVIDVDELPTHGGSLRVYACHDNCDDYPCDDDVDRILTAEREAGLDTLEYYEGFAEHVEALRRSIVSFFVEAAEQGSTVVGYGAPAKGNTLLNYCGVRPDWMTYTVDRNPHKQGLFLPGTRIPIHAPEKIAEDKPDYVFILPWNLREEIADQMAHIRDWGGKFVAPIPKIEIF